MIDKQYICLIRKNIQYEIYYKNYAYDLSL